MTKQKLIELCLKLRKKEITKYEILKLKDLCDDEIDKVLNGANKEILIKLLNNENFRNLPVEIKERIIKIINDCKDQYGKMEHIVNVATNKNAIDSNLLVELSLIISNAKGINQSYISSLVACDFNAISSGKVLILVKLISECIQEEQLKVAYYAAINFHIIKSGNVVNVVKSICNATDNQEALNIYYQAVNSSLAIKPLDALYKGNINSIDFWQIFSEEGEEANYLLDNIGPSEDLSQNTIITIANSQNKKR